MPIALILTAMPLISLCANRFFCMHTSISIISMRTITLRDRKTAKRILKIMESQNISHSIPPNNSRHIRHAAINYCLHFCGYQSEMGLLRTRTVRFYFVLLYGHNRLSEKIFVYKTKVDILKKIKQQLCTKRHGMTNEIKKSHLQRGIFFFLPFFFMYSFYCNIFPFSISIQYADFYDIALKLKETMQKTNFQFSFCDIPVNCFKNHSNFNHIFLVTQGIISKQKQL